MRTANPALNEKIFRQVGHDVSRGAMTVQGTVNKTGILLILAILPAAWVWNTYAGFPA